MQTLSKLLNEVGVSKVKLAKYLGVSRQMVYNYMESDLLENWPTEKKEMVCNLLEISSKTPDSDIKKIIVNNKFKAMIDKKIEDISNDNDGNLYFNLNSLNKTESTLVNDLTSLIKEKFSDEKNKNTYNEFLYLYHVLQSVDSVPEIKYIFAYLSKMLGFTSATEYAFDENAQFILESIVYTAMNLYNNGGATRHKLVASHERFEREIDSKKEEALSRTQQLNVFKLQALKELGYTSLTSENAQEVFNKMAEIQTRKVVNN